MMTTVSSERVIGLKYGYSPAAWTSRARVKFLHLSNSAMCCRVSVRTKPRVSMSKRWYSLAAHTKNRKRSEEHTSELQSPCNLVCRLLLEKKTTAYTGRATARSSASGAGHTNDHRP